jgi:hypothetical protein
MNNITLTFAFLFFSTMSIFSQNISVDKNCISTNSAIFGETLIQMKGEYFVSKLLDDNQSLLFFVNVDSVGSVRNVEKVNSKIDINDSIVKEIIACIIEKEIHFFYCFERPIGYTDKEAIKMLKKTLFHNNSNKLYLINISFPGDLMSLYYYKKDELSKKGIYLSKIEYLKLRIAEYLN